MTIDEIATLVAVLAGVCGIVFGIVGWNRNAKQDTTQDVERNTTVLTDLGYIKASVDDVKRKLEKQDERYVDIIERLSAVEQSSKQAHKRIDAIERTNNIEE